MNIDYIETTGPLTRVGVLTTDEEAACRAAMDCLGTQTTPCFTSARMFGWEVVFETADL